MRACAVRALLAGAATVACLLVPAPRATAEPTAGQPSTATLAAIETFLDREVHDRGLPGLEFALVHERSVLDLHAVGIADSSGRALTPRTPILLASLSKSLTATAVLQLVEAGKVRLDAPVTTYLPWFTTADPDRSAKITVAQLLDHTSGIPENTPSQTGALDDRSPAALELGVRRLDTVRLASEPGTTFLYSNTNYNVLGTIVQTVSGEPFADYLARHVFGPAGMLDASVGTPLAGAASGFYRWYGGNFRATAIPTPGSMTPSAITYASAADLAQLLIMNLNDGQVGAARILTPASVEELHRPAVAVDDFSAYAMGWNVRPGWEFVVPTAQSTASRVPLLVEHDGSWPNTRTYLGFLPQDKLGFALLINANQQYAESELNSLYVGVWRILAGQEPRDYPASEPLLQQYGWQIATAILLLLSVSLAWSIWLIRRTWTGHGPRTSRQLPIFAAMLAVDAGVFALIWLYLPAEFGTTTYAIVRLNPDVGILIAAIVVLLAWAPVRTTLALVTLRRRSLRADPEDPPLVLQPAQSATNSDECE